MKSASVWWFERQGGVFDGQRNRGRLIGDAGPAQARFGRPMLRAAAMTVLTLCASMAPFAPGLAGVQNEAPATSKQESYKLGPQDEIRVTVVEWRPARDEILEWTALKGNYTVGPSGKLALPLIGEVVATGSTT